jgi:hypothetical protein
MFYGGWWHSMGNHLDENLSLSKLPLATYARWGKSNEQGNHNQQ